jgi:hypothetical protein
MVTLDEGRDGVLTLRFLPPYAPDDEGLYLQALERIGQRRGPFALVTLFGGGGKLSAAGERAQALWFKRTRAAMNAACRGLAIVRPGSDDHMAGAFRRLWSFPVTIAADETEARRCAAEWLERVA